MLTGLKINQFIRSKLILLLFLYTAFIIISFLFNELGGILYSNANKQCLQICNKCLHCVSFEDYNWLNGDYLQLMFYKHFFSSN